MRKEVQRAMRLELGNLPKEKQKFVLIGLVVVIIAVAGFFIHSSMSGGSSSDQAAPVAGQDTAGAPPPPGAAGGPGAPPPGAVGAPGQPPSAPGTPPAAQPAATPAPSAPAVPAASRPAAAKSAATAPPKSITVFGSVTVSYPSGWGVGLGAGNAAVISDGKARFEVHTPDPKASDAKTIAAKAVTSLAGKAPGSLPQGPLKIGGYDSYYYMAGDKRIVGIDAPTRIVLVEYAKGAAFSAYSAAFDKMQADLKFK